MKNCPIVLSAGARNSKLSLAQTRRALAKLEKLIPVLSFEIVPFSSPGDRDKRSDLREMAPDFFTRDLDDAILNQQINCAIHSAKDLPEKPHSGLDVIYLPWREDQRDVLVYPKSKDIVSNPRIGVSSERREKYAAKRFPDGQSLAIRGNIDDRIAQLDAGKYDILIMAAAGLIRLALEDRISEYIPLESLTPPSTQGQLALVFKKNNSTFNVLRKLFVKPVVFAGAGIGIKENTTLGVIDALKNCDVCFYDALCPQELLGFLSKKTECIYVGKRKGKHSHSQTEICDMLLDYAKKGKRIVRLKGGDPGIFGRLAEETEALDMFGLPYSVLPGISSLSVATTSTGLILTRRGMARGFTVATPRKSGSTTIEWISDEEKKSFPQVFFMGVGELEKMTNKLLSDGCSPNLPAAVILNAGYPDRAVICGTVETIAAKLPETSMPGIVIVGNVADGRFLFREHGALNGMRVLFTGSETLSEKATREIRDFGGIPICMPMINLERVADIDKKITAADWLIVNSPSSAELLIESGIDLRELPKIAVCGKETAAVFKKHNVYPDICPERNFGTDGLFKALEDKIKNNDKLIRLCSDNSKSELTEMLRTIALDTEELVFYRNVPISYDSLPEFDAVLFTSPSTVNAFPASELENKKICVIGGPTEKALLNISTARDIIKGTDATISDMVFALAAESVTNILKRRGE